MKENFNIQSIRKFESQAGKASPFTEEGHLKMELLVFSVFVLVGSLITSIMIHKSIAAKVQIRFASPFSYRWWIFFSYLILFVSSGGLALSLIGFLQGNWRVSAEDRLFLIISGASALAAWFATRPGRWGFLAITALSLNPIIWIANGIYISRRWSDFGVKNTTRPMSTEA